MATMKRVFIIAVLCLIPALAKADNIVSVVMPPVNLDTTGEALPGGPWGASFTWDTTTQTLSNITMSVGGLVEQLPGVSGYVGDNQFIRLLNLMDPTGNLFQLNYGNHGGLVSPRLQSSPGLYRTDLFFICAQCFEHQNFAYGEAIVTAEPISTPEPSSLLLLGVGITALGLAVCAKNGLA